MILFYLLCFFLVLYSIAIALVDKSFLEVQACVLVHGCENADCRVHKFLLFIFEKKLKITPRIYKICQRSRQVVLLQRGEGKTYISPLICWPQTNQRQDVYANVHIHSDIAKICQILLRLGNHFTHLSLSLPLSRSLICYLHCRHCRHVPIGTCFPGLTNASTSVFERALLMFEFLCRRYSRCRENHFPIHRRYEDLCGYK